MQFRVGHVVHTQPLAGHSHRGAGHTLKHCVQLH